MYTWNEDAWQRHLRLVDDRTLECYGSSSDTAWRWYTYPAETVWLNRETAEEHRSYRVGFPETDSRPWPIL